VPKFPLQQSLANLKDCVVSQSNSVDAGKVFGPNAGLISLHIQDRIVKVAKEKNN